MTVIFLGDISNLIAGWLEGVLWGVHSLLFVTFTLVWKRKTLRDAITPATIAVIIMYILATIHMALELMRMVYAFITHRDDPGPVVVYASGGWVSQTANFINLVNTIIGDSILIWRLYIVWNKSILASAVGLIMVLGTTICGVTASAMDISPNASFETAIKWGTVMFITSLCTNIIVTLMIVGKILYQALIIKSVLGNMGNYHRVILMIIESGTLITASKLIEFTLFMLDSPDGNNALYIPNKCIPQIMGIAPLAILIAVATGFMDVNTYRSTATVPDSLRFAPQTTTATAEVDESDLGGQFRSSFDLDETSSSMVQAHQLHSAERGFEELRTLKAL